MTRIFRQWALGLAVTALFAGSLDAVADTCPAVSAIVQSRAENGFVYSYTAPGSDMRWSGKNPKANEGDLASLGFRSVLLEKGEGESPENVIFCDYGVDDKEQNKLKGFVLVLETASTVEKTGASWEGSGEKDDPAICDKGIEACTFDVQ